MTCTLPYGNFPGMESPMATAVLSSSASMVARGVSFEAGINIEYLDMGVSLNGCTPNLHPKCRSFLVGKPIGETHHFRKP